MTFSRKQVNSVVNSACVIQAKFARCFNQKTEFSVKTFLLDNLRHFMHQKGKFEKLQLKANISTFAVAIFLSATPFSFHLATRQNGRDTANQWVEPNKIEEDSEYSSKASLLGQRNANRSALLNKFVNYLCSTHTFIESSILDDNRISLLKNHTYSS